MDGVARSRGYPGFVAHPYREYSEVFFGDGYRVLRGGSWATHPRVATATFRNWDLPQRRQIFAGVRLAKEALTMDRDTREAVVVRSYLGPGDERSLADDVLDGLTRPFKELPPKHFYDARGARAVRPHLRAARVLPDARGAGDPRARGAEAIVELTGAGELVELGSGTATKTRMLLDAMHDAGTLRRYVPVDVTEGMVRATRRGARRRATRACASTASSATSSATSATCRRRSRPAHRRVPRRHDRQLPARQPPALPARDSRGCCGPDATTCCSAPTSSRTSAVLEAAYDDAEGVTAEFNRNVLRVINRELDADFDLDAFEHVAFFDREREWIEMRLRAQRAHGRPRRARST